MRHLLAASLFGLFALTGATQEPNPPPVQVKIQDEKNVVVEAVMPIDPAQRLQVQNQGNMMVSMLHDQRILQLGAIQTMFKIDNQFIFPGQPPSQLTQQNAPLPKTRDDKPRKGTMTVMQMGKLTITQEVEIVPTRGKPGEKRKLDSAMVRYIIENKDTQPHKVALRIFMDVYIIDNPGFVAHMTFKVGSGWDMPDRAVLTSLRAQRDQWNVGVQAAGGDSAMAVFWEEREIKPGATRKCAYGYGAGIPPPAEGDGLVAIALGGSFEPGKLFTVSAQVQDPSPGQSLGLELPAGMELVEGKERQPVPDVDATGNSLVLWKARVLRTGQFNLRVHSSNGVTTTKIITITRPGENK